MSTSRPSKGWPVEDIKTETLYEANPHHNVSFLMRGVYNYDKFKNEKTPQSSGGKIMLIFRAAMVSTTQKCNHILLVV